LIYSSKMKDEVAALNTTGRFLTNTIFI